MCLIWVGSSLSDDRGHHSQRIKIGRYYYYIIILLLLLLLLKILLFVMNMFWLIFFIILVILFMFELVYNWMLTFVSLSVLKYLSCYKCISRVSAYFDWQTTQDAVLSWCFTYIVSPDFLAQLMSFSLCPSRNLCPPLLTSIAQLAGTRLGELAPIGKLSTGRSSTLSLSLAAAPPSNRWSETPEQFILAFLKPTWV